jgi:hypothetical protein
MSTTDWWKPKDPATRPGAAAGALIAAEIERLDRLDESVRPRMIRVPERGPWKPVDGATQERDLRRYRLRLGWLGGLYLQRQIERRAWDFYDGVWRHSFVWRRAEQSDLPAVFSIIAEIPAYGEAGE